MEKKHKGKNNTNKYNIIKLFNEIEKELGAEDYNKLQDRGIDRKILDKIEYIIFEKYIDSVDIIKLNLRSYIREQEPKHIFFQPSNYINIILGLYSLFWTIYGVIVDKNSLIFAGACIIILIAMYCFDKLFDKYEKNKKFKLANILLDIIDMNESKVKESIK